MESGKRFGFQCSGLLPVLVVVPLLIGSHAVSGAEQTPDLSDESQAVAQPVTESGTDGSRERSNQLDAVQVVVRRDGELSRVIGAAQQIDAERLDREERDDLHRVLATTPGVNIRGEDGYGLRPNIGLRGTTTERSQKINILEDGVLITPAPYSAPAAYYVPMISRMTGIEVVKGPSAITHGPNTVGGTINLITRAVPYARETGLDLALGTDRYRKGHLYHGDSTEQFGYLVEGLHLGTDGFKNLDGGGDTGFVKNNATVKLRFNTPLVAEIYQQLELKLNVADELSDETYLGLTDRDFAKSPYRRYAASQNGLMDWTHQQINLGYMADFNNGVIFHSTLYHHDFARDWTKLNRFSGSAPSLLDVLLNPDAGINQNFIRVLRGEEDSIGPDQTLMIGTNGRSFFSRGLQSRLSWQFHQGAVEHAVLAGLRYHEDQISRRHTERGFRMTAGELVADGNSEVTTVRNIEQARALAFFLQDEVGYARWKLRAGLRGEYIDYRSEDRKQQTRTDSDMSILLPALGVFYELTPVSGIFAGLHRGFVPTGPGQSRDIDPEESLNYELGYRYASAQSGLELIGFFTDYSNLKGVCTFSSGCSVANGESFNGGQADILGVELVASRELSLRQGLNAPLQLVYTYTQTEFRNSFDSDFPLWGRVRKGDALPYMPEHRLQLSGGISADRWDVSASVSYVGEQLEQAGVAGKDDGDSPLAGKTVDAHVIADIVARYRLEKRHTFYGKIDNLLDRDYLISRRPFGARPGKPRQFQVGYKYAF